MLNQVEYYRDPFVRRRLRELLRRSAYIVGFGESELWRGNPKGFYPAQRSGLDKMLTQGLDILTSLEQSDSTIGIIDIEYYNPHYPGEAHLNPERVFRLLEPVYRIIRDVYRSHGIPFLADITGQGYHFWTKFQFNRGHAELEKLARIEPSLEAAYRRKRIKPHVARGFCGMGRLQLYLAHEIYRRAIEARKRGVKILPICFSDVYLPGGREAISLDLTGYADPIFMRVIRIPFSAYQKHKVLTDKIGAQNAARIPIEILVPRHFADGRDIGLRASLKLRRHFRNAARLARGANCFIPDASRGYRALIHQFMKSDLGRFFWHLDTGPESRPQFTYKSLPPCIRHALRPDQLLEPTQAQAAIRVLDKTGMHPKHIAEVLYAKYRRTPFGSYDPQRRAYFWTEVFGSLIHTGLDRKSDLTCRSHMARHRCVQPNCGFDLSGYK